MWQHMPCLVYAPHCHAARGVEGRLQVKEARLQGSVQQTDLCVCQVVSFIVVEGETEAALILSQVISHEVRVL